MYTIKRMPEFDEWLASLRDGMTRIRLTRRLEKCSAVYWVMWHL